VRHGKKSECKKMSNFDAELCRKEMEFTRSGLKMHEIKIEQTFEELVGFGSDVGNFGTL